MKLRFLGAFFVSIICAGLVQADSDALTTQAISAGQRHGLALRSDGTVWSWGTNRVGELGQGTNSLVLSPRRISSLSNMLAIAAGPQHSLAVSSNGAVWAWGTNFDGRLGSGNFTSASNPVAVATITNAIAVAAGATHSLAALSDGRVMAWGANGAGQLGIGNNISTNKPVVVDSFTNVIAVAAGTNFSLALTASGDVWAWGTNNLGQLGLGNNTSQTVPVKISTLSNIVQIAAGHSHALARNQAGQIFAWGRNAEGQVGDGTTNNVNTPALVASFGTNSSYGTAKWITANFNSTAAVGSGGRLFYWGAYGDSITNGFRTQAVELGAGSGQVFESVSYGDSYLLANQADGSVWGWGFNLYGQWGNGAIRTATDDWIYETVNPTFCFSAQPRGEVTRYSRGDREVLPYTSFVLPLDMQMGVRLDAEGSDQYCYGAGAPWFMQVKKTQRQEAWKLIGGTTNLTRFNVENPIVAFGSDAGGSSLYTGRPYTFGAYGGAFDEKTSQTNMIRILVYDRAALNSGATNVQPTNTFTITLPRRYIAGDSNAWSNFITNNSRIVVETNGLRTAVEFADALLTYPALGTQDAYNNWGVYWQFAFGQNVVMGGYRITHQAASTNYCYIVEVMGSVEVGANVMAPMAVTNGTGWSHLPMYALGFESFPEWRSHYIDTPHYEGIALPPAYTGRRLSELSGLTAEATNVVWLTNDVAYTNLDASPELRRHAVLDQLVEDLGRNPLALATYVVNEIELTDPVAAYESSKVVEDSIELGGVSRSALATYLEGQGSPAEQCALLVYLLRQAGYPAGYVFPTNNNLRLLDTTVSRLWQINVKGVQFHAGVPVVTNSLIAVNYPWVVANIGTNVVHIFPWLKNTEIVEGEEIYDFLPTNYPSAYPWIKDYALAKPEIMDLADDTETAAVFWQRYLTGVLSTNQIQPNLSLDDFGVRSFNRRLSITKWTDLPKPNFLTNQAQVAVVPTLTENPATYPFLTNLFDRVQVEVFKDNTNAANKLFDTGLWRASDLHNRKLLLYTNTASTVALWLAPYRDGLTNNSAFTNFESGTASLNLQMVQTNVAATVSNLAVRVTYQRRSGTYADPDSWYPLQEPGSIPFSFTAEKKAVTVIYPSFGRVTTAMQQMHAQGYLKLQQQRALNPSFVPDVTEDVGTAATLLASGYFQRLWSDDQLNQQLHKVRGLFWNSWGAIGITKRTNGTMIIKLDMAWIPNLILGNARVRQDSTDRGQLSLADYRMMNLINGASGEHAVIANMFGSPAPLSSVRLIQMAAIDWRDNGLAVPPELNVKNYVAIGNKAQTGYGSTLLKNQDPAIWASVSNAFTTTWDTNYVRVLITPGPVTNNSGTFSGMSALTFGRFSGGAMLGFNSKTLNGGFDASLSWFGTPTFSTYQLSYNISYSPAFGYSFVYNNYTTPQPRYDFSQNDYVTLATTNGVGLIAFTPQQLTLASNGAADLNISTGTSGGNLKAVKDAGWLGPASAGTQQKGSTVSDPVHVVTGDFCADSVDVALAGPLPLALRRNYFSRTLVDNQFGYGWKMSFMPWLVLSTNTGGSLKIQAAEPDGAVIAYRYQTNNVWTVTPADNPALVNFTGAGIGSTANPFNARIEKSTNNGEMYVLTSPNGDKRSYLVMTNFGLTSGTNYLSRIRPYLIKWEDHAGNYHTFSYGTNSAANDFGQVNRVQSANGAFLILKYDGNGRIIEAFTDDNRRVRYAYDSFGDLVGVTLPDDTGWLYEYQHYSFTNGTKIYTDSTHLLVKETKPDGRLLQNNYDNLRRVTSQMATVGQTRALATNAWFFYTNNVTTLTNDVLTGTTRVEDVFHNAYLYSYTNNLITRIVEPLGRTNIQNWFEAAETNKAGYYPRSLELAVDPRGLTNEFSYTTNGNLTTLITRGNLTGTGNAGESATNTFTFTTNNLPATSADPAGNGVSLAYEDAADAWRPTTVVRFGGGVPVATNTLAYTNATETVTLATLTQTNQSFGLLARLVRAGGATNEWSHNGRGFPTRSIRFARTSDNPGTADPAVTNYLSFSLRGDLIQATDAAGRSVQMSHDAAGRMLWRDVLDESGTALARENFYFNRNGELEWYDGPRSNPEDLIHYDYDGAGRLVEELRWRSRAKTDGSGVEAESGDDLYATTFHRFDAFGNLLSTRHPNRSVTTNIWDALGRLSSGKVLDATGTQLTSQGFAYEPGGLVTRNSNALGGVTETLYTSTGQPRYQKNPDDSTNGWTYYLDGRLARAFARNGAYAETTYDDANRKVTAIYYSAVGTPLATNSSLFDVRGNLVVSTDAGGNSFTNAYDGLDRLKSSAGPSIVFENPPDMPAPPGGPPPPIQQTFTRYFDAAGLVLTNVNGLGEKAITYFDALGRSTRSEIRKADNTLVREASASYSADHHSVTTTTGSGTGAIVSTSFTDNDGNPVLSISYPGSNLREFMRWDYAVSGDMTFAGHYSTSNGVTALWSQSQHTYDGLHRPLTTTDRDNALTTFAYNTLGNVTNRTMPGGLKWRADYNAAGRLLKSWNLAPDNSGTRTNTYTYFTAGSPFVGLLNTHTDGRGVVCAVGYDDFLRPTTNAYSGSLAEHNLTTTRKFDARGLLTEVSESFANSTNGPSTLISRSYDPYGQLDGETISLGGNQHSTTSQQWDSGGRRDWLSFFTFGYNFGWQADGQLSSLSAAAGWVNGSYSYNTAGLLNTRGIGGLSVNVTSRDGMGRPTARTSAVNSVTRLSETLSWTADGLLAAHSLARTGDYTDARSYGYESLSRRLATEQLKLNATAGWTNVFDYDEGTAGGPGVLTRMAEPQVGGAEWTAELDGFNRIERETNNVVRRPAQGRLNATPIYGTVSAALDGRALTVNTFATGDPNWPTEWRTEMELRPGTRTLVATAQHSSRLFTTNASVTFTNNAVDQTTVSHFAEGQLSYRLWKNSFGQTNRVQSFTWDARSRLIATTEVDANNNGYNWSAVYDGFGRRLQTTTILVTNGVAWTNQPKVIASYFDPGVEFMEVGMKISGKVRWKIYGPDTDGSYGGMNGTGGFEGYVDDVGVFRPLISDARGDVHGTYDPVSAAMQWNTSRPTGYGAVPEYRPLSLADNGDLGAASAWRGRCPDRSGFYWLGARYYDPVAGRFISCDPYGHGADPSLYAFCGGDPINMFDPDGRFGKGAQLQSALYSAFTARTCVDCHWNPNVLALGILPGDTPWYNHAGVNAVNTRIGGGVKVVGGIAGMTLSGAGELGSGGLASPIAAPAFAGSAAMSSLGLRELITGESVTLSGQLVKAGADPEKAAAIEFMLNSSVLMSPGTAFPAKPITSGETLATASGKAIHRALAAERRASGDFDLVASPIVDSTGKAILVTRRVDLKTGNPLPSTGFQTAVPDAVSYEARLILDDKPVGRLVSKDRQEIIRFIRAYEQGSGSLPSRIAIQRYDPATGLPVVTELYTPADFLPKSK